MSVDLKMPVLVVDDYETMVRILRNLLVQFGFENVFGASDGAEALVLLRQHRFGLIISDWKMEPMTGLELLQHVRADPRLKPIPFILATAEAKPELVIAAREAGVDNYILKPFNAVTLRHKIEAVIGTFRSPAHPDPFASAVTFSG